MWVDPCFGRSPFLRTNHSTSKWFVPLLRFPLKGGSKIHIPMRYRSTIGVCALVKWDALVAQTGSPDTRRSTDPNTGRGTARRPTREPNKPSATLCPASSHKLHFAHMVFHVVPSAKPRASIRNRNVCVSICFLGSGRLAQISSRA